MLVFQNLCRLKSNMDRFIETHNSHLGEKERSLKSNMDRFIESGCSIIPKTNESLKSNMDRFIVPLVAVENFVIAV